MERGPGDLDKEKTQEGGEGKVECSTERIRGWERKQKNSPKGWMEKVTAPILPPAACQTSLTSRVSQ